MYTETGQKLKNWYDYIWKGNSKAERERERERDRDKKKDRNCENVDF